MSLLNWLGSLDGRQRAAIIAVVVLVLTAGCLGLGDSGGDDPEMDGNENSNDDPGENNGDNNDGTDEQPLAANASVWLDRYDDIGDPADDVSVEDLVADAIAAADGVEAYQYTRSTQVFEETARQQVLTSSTQETAVDVSNQEISFTRSVSNSQLDAEVEGYLLNGTVYQRSDQFEQQYGSAWVRQNVSENYQNAFLGYHTIQSLSQAMENSSATLHGTTEMNGETAHVVSLDVSQSLSGNTTAAGQQSSVNGSESQLLVWISESSNRMLRAASYSSFSQSTANGDVQSTVENDFEFEYTSVDVTLPEGAENATEVGN